MRERRVASSEQWGNPGLGQVQAGSSPAQPVGGKYLISGRNIEMKNVQLEELQTLNKIPSLINAMEEDIYFSGFTGKSSPSLQVIWGILSS